MSQMSRWERFSGPLDAPSPTKPLEATSGRFQNGRKQLRIIS